MPVRLLAVDLDGTLLNTRGEISVRNLDAIEAARKQGVTLVIVTGRRFHSAQPFLSPFGDGLTVISSNGARIGTMRGEVHYRDFLPRHVARQVIDAAYAYRGYAALFFDMAGLGQIVMHQDAVPEGPVGWYLRNSRECLVQTSDLAAALTSDPIQVMFGGPPERIEPVERALAPSLLNGLCHLTWTKYLLRNLSLLDVINRGCSKGAALGYWAGRCGIRAADVMALGDNLNDLEMLRFAGQPVLMANHNLDSVPREWGVTLSNDEDGVAAAIERYILSP